MIGFEFGIGTLLALLTFLRSEVSGRCTKGDLLRIMDENGKAEQFREWLRQQDQAGLIRQIEASKSNLLSQLTGLGGRLDQFASEVLRISVDLQQRFQDLNAQIQPPVLSLLSLQTRPRASTAIKGRERESKWLIESTGDALVSGQPGSGKTELLQSFAAEQDARFLITDNPDKAAAALTASRPPIVIVDDAGTKRDLIIRLRHLRSEQGANFRIIAICWPFDKLHLQQALQVNDTATLDLEGLPRKVIAEIITDIAAAQRVTVSDELIRVVAKQARGMPGLAAALSLATIATSGEALVSGELLLRDLTPFLLNVAGTHTVRLLGAFACGGQTGISVVSTSKILEMDILRVTGDAQRVALAGVLEQTGKETLCVQPAFLRSALLKETFFRTDGLALPWPICEALIESAEDPVIGYVEIFHARARAGAVVPTDLIREITMRVNDSRLWDATAALDAANCEWVIENVPELSAEIKRAALHYIPVRIIPHLLGVAVSETRPQNALPETDMRLLEDWISGGWTDAVERRRALFGAAVSWLKNRGDACTALTAIRLTFGLSYRESDSDPADPRTIRWRDALLPIEVAQAVFAYWDVFLQELSSMQVVPWSGVIDVIENWLRAGTRRGEGLPSEYAEFLQSSALRMLQDLIPLAHDNQAVLRWIYLRGQKLGMLIEPCPLVREFFILFPKEPHDGDWEENEQNQIRQAQELAVTWKDRPIRDVIEELTAWERQAEALGRVWPQRSGVFANRLAEIKPVTAAELTFILDRASQQVAIAFIDTALAQGRMDKEHLQQALKRVDLHGFLLKQTLTGKTPELYSQLESEIPKWRLLAESVCFRGEAPTDVLEKLLRHEDRDLRRAVALHMFRAKGGIPHSIWDQWRGVIVQSLIEYTDGYDADHPYDLAELLASDQTIARAVLDGILRSGSPVHGFLSSGLMSQIITPLGKEERRSLLHRCKHLAYSSLPRLLVGGDEDLYREFLGIAEFKSAYYSALIGDPNEGNWIALAKVALAAGHSHEEISYAVNAGGYSWTGRLSKYYQQWVERFERLRQNSDPDIQRIGNAGLIWAVARRDAELRSERREEIHGLD